MLQNKIDELMAERNDFESKISSMDSRFLSVQREATCMRDIKDKLEYEVGSLNFKLNPILIFIGCKSRCKH